MCVFYFTYNTHQHIILSLMFTVVLKKDKIMYHINHMHEMEFTSNCNILFAFFMPYQETGWKSRLLFKSFLIQHRNITEMLQIAL